MRAVSHYLKPLRISLILLIFLFSFYSGKSNDILTSIRDESEIIHVDRFEYLIDAGESLGIEEVKALARDGKFFQYKPGTSVKIGRNVHYWIHYSLVNESHMDERVLHNANDWSYMNMFTIKNNGIMTLQRTGHMVPYNDRDYAAANHNYILTPIRSGEKLEFFLELTATDNGLIRPKNLEIDILKRGYADQLEGREHSIVIGLMCIYAVIIAYNLFMFLSSRVRFQGYYLVLLFTGLWAISTSSGYMIELLAPFDLGPLLNKHARILLYPISGIPMVAFAMVFLKTAKRSIVAHRLFQGFILFQFLCVPVFYYDFDLGFTIISIFTVVMALSLLTYGVISVVKKFPSALIFVIGNALFWLGGAIHLLGLKGYLPIDTLAVKYAFTAGNVLEIIIFSMAIGNKIRLMRGQIQEKRVKLIEQLKENEKLQAQVTHELEQKVEERTQEIREKKEALAKEKEKAEELLLNILPSCTAEELKTTGKAEPKHFDTVSILFTDFKGFTKISESMTSKELVKTLDQCFRAFDRIVAKHNIEKIKTIGDAYMAAGGVPEVNETNPIDAVRAGLEIQAFMNEWNADRISRGLIPWELRLGIHTGPVTSGVVGKNKFAYDIWGDAVNLAARVESESEPGKVNISGFTYELIKDRFDCFHRGKIQAKHKGMVDMYFVNHELEAGERGTEQKKVGQRA